MKKLYLLFAMMFLVLIPYANATTGVETISGQVIFAIDYAEWVMKENGYHFVGAGTYGSSVTNYFGAKDADIVVKNAKGDIIGVTKTKSDGTFEIKVEKSNFYQFVIDWHGKKWDKTLSNSDAIKPIQFDFGRFDSEQFPLKEARLKK